MTDTADDEIERAVAEAIEPEQRQPAEQQIETIDLGPAYHLLIEKLSPLRTRLLKDISSPVARNFSEQLADLRELHALTRAFDIMAGYVSPDGRMLTPMSDPDPKSTRRRHEYIDETVGRSTEHMRRRALRFSNVPIEPIRADDPPGSTGYEPPGRRMPGWLSRGLRHADAEAGNGSQRQ